MHWGFLIGHSGQLLCHKQNITAQKHLFLGNVWQLAVYPSLLMKFCSVSVQRGARAPSISAHI